MIYGNRKNADPYQKNAHGRKVFAAKLDYRKIAQGDHTVIYDTILRIVNSGASPYSLIVKYDVLPAERNNSIYAFSGGLMVRSTVTHRYSE